MKVRDEIYLEVMKNGWNEEKQCFVQFYGSDTLDASALIMPLVFFTAPNDPRLVKTLDYFWSRRRNFQYVFILGDRSFNTSVTTLP